MKYAKLYGLSDRTTEELNSIEEVAKFIMKEGLHSDVKIITEEGEHLLDTFGIFINKISDMEYRKQLLKILVPMQTNMKLKEEFVKIKICSMGGTVYFIEIPYQIYDQDMIDIWIEQNLKNVDYWEYWK